LHYFRTVAAAIAGNPALKTGRDFTGFGGPVALDFSMARGRTEASAGRMAGFRSRAGWAGFAAAFPASVGSYPFAVFIVFIKK